MYSATLTVSYCFKYFYIREFLHSGEIVDVPIWPIYDNRGQFLKSIHIDFTSCTNRRVVSMCMYIHTPLTKTWSVCRFLCTLKMNTSWNQFFLQLYESVLGKQQEKDGQLASSSWEEATPTIVYKYKRNTKGDARFLSKECKNAHIDTVTD